MQSRFKEIDEYILPDEEESDEDEDELDWDKENFPGWTEKAVLQQRLKNRVRIWNDVCSLVQEIVRLKSHESSGDTKEVVVV